MFFKNRQLKGFSLVELLIAMVIFTIFIGSASVILVYVQRGYEKALITQKLSSETFFVMEKMSQALRNAQEATDSACIPSGYFYEITDGNKIRFIIDQDGEFYCQEFSLENGILKIIDLGKIAAPDFPDDYSFDLISPRVRAKRINVRPIFAPISIEQPTELEQPRVHIHISLYMRTAAGLLITQESRTAVSIR